jgi:acyl dehydratase
LKIDDLHAGLKLGPSAWRTLLQEQVNLFADATDDHQWIHIDPERAKKGPFGAAVAHGHLTLSLLSAFMYELMPVDDASAVINYGFNRIRFPAPVVVGSRIRAHFELADVSEVAGGIQVEAHVEVECEGLDKPPCVAQALTRYYR